MRLKLTIRDAPWLALAAITVALMVRAGCEWEPPQPALPIALSSFTVERAAFNYDRDSLLPSFELHVKNNTPRTVRKVAFRGRIVTADGLTTVVASEFSIEKTLAPGERDLWTLTPDGGCWGCINPQDYIFEMMVTGLECD